MKPCEFETYLSDYLAGELSSSKSAEIKAHLMKCETCVLKLEAYQEVHQMLIHRPRLKFPDEILRDYRWNLKAIFKAKSRVEIIKEKFWEFWESAFGSQPFWVRIVKAVALLFIGFFFGWLIFSPVPELKVIPTKPEILMLSVSQADIEAISNFLFESEILLLQIVNSNSNEATEPADLLLTKEISQNLLMRTFFIHEKALQLQDERILRFLTQMELLLLEISNSSNEDTMDAVKQIKQIIKDVNLLNQAENLQDMLDNMKSRLSV